MVQLFRTGCLKSARDLLGFCLCDSNLVNFGNRYYSLEKCEKVSKNMVETG